MRPPSPTRKRFGLRGRSRPVDTRVDAARGDLADIRLADRLFAPHYAAALPRGAVERTSLFSAIGAPPASELLVGERFDVLELSRGYAWGVSSVDGAVGFVSEHALGLPVEATHVICAPVAHLAGGTNLPMGSRVAGMETAAGLQVDGVLLPADVARPLASPVHDFVALAESLVGTPAAIGGRSGAGVDATGLVVLALGVAGIPAPRFIDLQAALLGHGIAEDAPMLRGDLLYFADHVAIVADGTQAIHVSAAGAVAREAIADIVSGGTFGPLLTRRRLP